MVKEQLTGGGGVLASQWQLTDADLFAQPPDYVFDASRWPRHNGPAGAGRGSAFFVGDESGDYVLRHYRRGGMVAALSHRHYVATGAGRSRAFREWRLLATLFNEGLPVPAPAAARYVRAGLLYTATLLTRAIPNSRTLAACLGEAPLDTQQWRSLGGVLSRFHARGACHADLNAHNILRADDGAFFLIDFDRGSLRTPGDWCVANLVRLRRSLDKLSAEPAGLHFSEDDWNALDAGYGSSSSASDA